MVESIKIIEHRHVDLMKIEHGHIDLQPDYSSF